jgi:hypothetical protein
MQTFYYIASWVAALAVICHLILILYKIFFPGKSLSLLKIIKHIPLLVILMCLVLVVYTFFDEVTDSNYSFYWKDLVSYLILFVPFVVMLIVQWMWNGFVTWNKDYRKWKQILLYLFAFIMLVWFWFIAYMFYKFGANYHCEHYCRSSYCSPSWICTSDCWGWWTYCITHM